MNKKIPGDFWTTLICSALALLVFLLISNIALLLCGIGLNKCVCMEAARAGAAACVNGGNQQDIEAAVFRSINDSGVNVFFINHPELGEIKFYIKDENGHKLQMLQVKTVTGVRVPAPFLLFVAQPEQNGFIHFSCSCAIKLKEFRFS